VRAMIQSYEKYDFVLTKEIEKFISQRIIYEPTNYETLLALVFLLIFPVFSYLIEKFAAQPKVNRYLVNFITIIADL
jgi:hypothetical protein